MISHTSIKNTIEKSFHFPHCRRVTGWCQLPRSSQCSCLSVWEAWNGRLRRTSLEMTVSLANLIQTPTQSLKVILKKVSVLNPTVEMSGCLKTIENIYFMWPKWKSYTFNFQPLLIATNGVTVNICIRARSLGGSIQRSCKQCAEIWSRYVARVKMWKAYSCTI